MTTTVIASRLRRFQRDCTNKVCLLAACMIFKFVPEGLLTRVIPGLRRPQMKLEDI